MPERPHQEDDAARPAGPQNEAPAEKPDAGASRADYRSLPSVDRVVNDARVREAGLPPAVVTTLAREVLAEARATIAAGYPSVDIDALVANVLSRGHDTLVVGPRQVINATGVILHTNLGRAPLSRAARAAMDEAARGYSNLEFELALGERGSRHTHVEAALRRATGAEAGMAVNNNAAALLLVLSALCSGKEVIISRGQLVEIGGGFRIPDVLRQSGARLIEVGATNRTYDRDFEAAAGGETAAILRVHSSNFRQVGFVTEPGLAELRRVASAHRTLLLDDIGSGALLDTTRFGLAPEPTAQESLRAGADLVLFSGDKLLGGPQAGIIAGRADLIATLKRHPLARAVRMDKASIAGLTATLLHYVRGEAEQEIPIWRMIAQPRSVIEERAAAWRHALGGRGALQEARAMIGGGSLPEEGLAGVVLALPHPAPHELAARLRLGRPAVVARVERGQILFDPRTVQPEEDGAMVARLLAELGP